MTDEHTPPEGPPASDSAPRPPAAAGGPEPGTGSVRPDDEINLLDYLLVLVKHKKLILGTSLAAFVLACIVTLFKPNIYTATARILPPVQEKTGLGAMLGGMADQAALVGVSLGSGLGDLYVGMLKSRTVSDAVIDRFDLMTVYEQEYRARMYQKLESLVSVSLGKKDGIIALSVDDEDPERAAAIANAYVEELKKLNVRLNFSNAGRERIFLEERLHVVRAGLLRAEEALKDFQETNKAIRIDDQATAIIEAIAKLRGELAGKEVALGVLVTHQTEQSAQVKAAREGILQLKEQLRRLEQSPEARGVDQDSFLATSDVPELGLQYARLLRDYKVQEALFELLIQQFEIAKITEAKNTSPLQVLDEAVAPDRKSKPKRSVIVLAFTMAVGFLMVFVAFVLEYLARMPNEDRQRWAAIKKNVRAKGLSQEGET